MQRKIDLHKVLFQKRNLEKVVVLMDTTYWHKVWSNAFKDAYTKENLLKYYVKDETNVT